MRVKHLVNTHSMTITLMDNWFCIMGLQKLEQQRFVTINFKEI